ncbi:N-acylethanolamine-hydrolyzing acid amidase-like [Sycon ciliatum]|uniref:N-acylethanolamine-hydrolyzing acid amidase-like n=1 Tax=Sycon ciliatum TaxID=27933 RepID=UPI0020AB9623|eukprot:scpid64106/ scgid25166/ N-acylethanolamine-hydrolyzing acid amidase; N-acylsphingosine amidohydrolase-like
MCKYVEIVAVLLCTAVGASLGTEYPVPTFTIDLDAAPEVRFHKVNEYYKHMAPAFVEQISTVVPKEFQGILEAVAVDYMHARVKPVYVAEMTALAKTWNISVGYVVAANLIYDFTAACTSIVMQAENGTILHGRNLDYSFGGVLRNVTYIGDFQRGGKTAYKLTTYGGYFGALSGMRPGGFTVTVDERDQGAVWENIAMALFDRKSDPLGFFVRETLDTDGIDFVQAVETLSTTPLIAPVYLIVGGVTPGQGAVITRDQLGAIDTYYLDADKGRWYVLETNYDHWKPPPKTDDRRDPAEKILNAAGRSQVGYALLQKVLNTPPILNSHTTYTVLMSAAHPDDYKSWVQRI